MKMHLCRIKVDADGQIDSYARHPLEDSLGSHYREMQ